jgi:indolepyruvate ferredoxin oxidoreductase
MLTDSDFRQFVQRQVPGGEKLTYKLHPPLLKALGRRKKISMGPRTHFTLRLMA